MEEGKLETLQNLVVHNQKNFPCNPTVCPYPCISWKTVDLRKVQTLLLCIRCLSLASTQGHISAVSSHLNYCQSPQVVSPLTPLALLPTVCFP